MINLSLINIGKEYDGGKMKKMGGGRSMLKCIKWILVSVAVVFLTGCKNSRPLAVITVTPGTTINQGESITLDGNKSSDSDGSIVSYEWKEGDTILSTSYTPSFVMTPSVGTHTITLSVTDDDGATATNSIIVTVNAVETNTSTNTPPAATITATPGTTINQGQSVTLDGSGSSDIDGDIVSYEWRENTTILSHSMSFVSTTLTAGTHTITLTVRDNQMGTATDSIIVTVNAIETNTSINTPPTANAGSDQSLNQGESVTLDASGSSDSDGSIISYEWREGDTILSHSMSFVSTTLTAGTHTITLSVTDDQNATASTTITITVNSATATSTSVKKTGQTKSYDTLGIEVTDRSLKDDGYYQKGVAPNYTRDDTTQIVTDHTTGLMWQDDTDAKTIMKPWVTQANYNAGNYSDTSGDTVTTYCANLTLGGYSDWRLPTSKELESIVDYGKFFSAMDTTFTNVSPNNLDYRRTYWSSTAYADYPRYAWSVYCSYGNVDGSNKYLNHYVRCVRVGQ